jgi:hypothetical protein
MNVRAILSNGKTVKENGGGKVCIHLFEGPCLHLFNKASSLQNIGKLCKLGVFNSSLLSSLLWYRSTNSTVRRPCVWTVGLEYERLMTASYVAHI